MGSIEITAELQARGPGSAFVLTDEQVAAVGEGAKRFPAATTINGHRLRTTVVKMRGEFLFGLSKAARQEASIEIGDTMTFTLELDQAPREVEVPAALAAALDSDPEAKRAFEGLAYTHRKEFARWIDEAKREETRERRVVQAIEMIRSGRTRS
jgi:hypothetical protein